MKFFVCYDREQAKEIRATYRNGFPISLIRLYKEILTNKNQLKQTGLKIETRIDPLIYWLVER